MRNLGNIMNIIFDGIIFITICGLLVVVLPSSLHGQFDRLPAELELLKTPKEEMVKWKSASQDAKPDEYLIGGKMFRAVFASERCLWHGWDVDKGTLISLTLVPTGKRIIDTTKLLQGGYELYITDTLDQFYGNSQSGLLYFVREFDKELLRLTFHPSQSDATKRCKGFPEFRVLPTVYSSYESFNDLGDLDSWDEGLLGDFASRLSSNANLNGYIFIYSKDPCTKGVSNLKSRIEKWLIESNKLSSSRITVFSGGVRDKDIVDVFLMSNKNSPPVPYAERFSRCELK